MIDIGSYTVRVILVFIFTYFGTRLLSKKAISEMTAYDIAGIILLTTVAAEPLVTKVTVKAIYGTGLLLLLMFLTAKVSLINKLGSILEHTPTIIIRNGNIDLKNLKSEALGLNELYGLLRDKGYASVADIEFAIMEPQGKLSVIPKSDKRPIKPGDLNLTPSYEGLTLPLVIDGAVIEKNLAHANLSLEWLVRSLKSRGITDIKNNVVLAELDSNGTLHIQIK